MSIDVTQNIKNKFSFKPMQVLAAYLGTFNCESQVIAIDANTEDIQSTGTKLAMINGQPEKIEVDAALDISGDTEGTLTAWADDTSYSVGDVRSKGGQRWRCIAAHTSDSDNKPNGPTGDTYWEEQMHSATNASGTSISAGYDQWLLVTAKAGGTLTVWEAGDEATTGNAVCKVPLYDPKLYVPIGFLHIANGTSSAFVVGTTGLDTASVTDTFVQVTGPVFPHEDNFDRN